MSPFFAIPASLAAEIRRLRSVEGWRIHTIARHLGVHHSTVKRALRRAGIRLPGPRRRKAMLDPYVDFVRATLEKYPRLPASVLHEMVVRRGYQGGADYFRHRIQELGLRPRRAPEAFFSLETLPGEQAQVDWAHFGVRKVDGGTRRLMAFVMVLSYSRWIFLRFFWNERLPSFLAGHVAGFRFFGGVPRTALYDNLKSAVLEREGDAVRFHPRMLEMADHYGYQPRPVAPARGNEKGRVERAIRYVRTSFFPLRKTWSIDELNHSAEEWCLGIASRRPWPQDRRRTVLQAYREELGFLRPVPEDFPAHEEVLVDVGKTPVVRFDSNRYTVPHDRIRRPLTLMPTSIGSGSSTGTSSSPSIRDAGTRGSRSRRRSTSLLWRARRGRRNSIGSRSACCVPSPTPRSCCTRSVDASMCSRRPSIA